MTTIKPQSSRWSGVLRGCAYGDAWGDKNEFKRYLTLRQDHGPMGPELPENLRITDDTQMTLSLARALNGAADLSPNMIRARIIDEWVDWYHDKDNNRAPGNRCMAACHALAKDKTWMEATDEHSDGCGTVMRTSACAFLPEGIWQPVAAWQAVSTHGGPNGVAAALIATAVIRRAAQGLIYPGQITEEALKIAQAEPDSIYDFKNFFNMNEVGRWLAWHPAINSYDRADQRAFLREGFDATANVIEHALSAVDFFQKNPWEDDPCVYGGQGWRAHECLATACLSADTFPEDPVLALRRATMTNGDSDSIAAVAGALIGSVHYDPWPLEWRGRLEPRYQAWIGMAELYDFGGVE